jgi:hypothetical protein
MFYNQCNDCGERWEIGTASACTCPKPHKWVGLVDEEIEQLAAMVWYGGASAGHERFAKLVEAKLKEKNQ